MSYTIGKQEEMEEPFQRITTDQARALIDSGEARLIDVREPNEWAESHIPRAEHVPLAKFLANPTSYVQPTDSVIFQCAIGQRSAVASEMAAAIGLTSVYNMEGGIKDWTAKGYPIEK